MIRKVPFLYLLIPSQNNKRLFLNIYINKVVGILSACFSYTWEKKLPQTTEIVKKTKQSLKVSTLLKKNLQKTSHCPPAFKNTTDPMFKRLIAIRYLMVNWWELVVCLHSALELLGISWRWSLPLCGFVPSLCPCFGALNEKCSWKVFLIFSRAIFVRTHCYLKVDVVRLRSFSDPTSSF